MTGPQLDEYLRGAGEDVEDVSRVAAAQPYRATGPTITRQGLALWAAAGRGPVKVRRLTEHDAEQWQRLCDGELAMPDGTLTPVGRDLLGQLERHDQQVRVEATNGQEAFSFVAHGTGARFVTVATSAPRAATGRVAPRELAATAHTFTLGVHHRSMLPVALASWLGIAPAWSVRTSPEELDTEHVEARLADDRAPAPPGSDDALREVWAQPWVVWTLTTTPATHGMAMVHAGARGHLALVDAGAGRTRLVPVPSRLVWLDVVRAVVQRS